MPETVAVLAREVKGLREDLQQIYLTKEEVREEFLSKEEAQRHRVRLAFQLVGTLVVVTLVMVGVFFYNEHAAHARAQVFCQAVTTNRADLLKAVDEAFGQTPIPVSSLPPSLQEPVRQAEIRNQATKQEIDNQLKGHLACPLKGP